MECWRFNRDKIIGANQTSQAGSVEDGCLHCTTPTPPLPIARAEWQGLIKLSRDAKKRKRSACDALGTPEKEARDFEKVLAKLQFLSQWGKLSYTTHGGKLMQGILSEGELVRIYAGELAPGQLRKLEELASREKWLD